ncbi:MAG: hypothetical protein HZA93_25025 [Verrucomicrobia bacterium]|nr:hypothetical protein [Verrucomicrobiota bacterium]
MSLNPHAQFDETVLEMIEHSPVGAVPNTPSYQDALGRLYASHQVYHNANHKDGHVTVRSLTRLPAFQADNLDALIGGRIAAEALEPNAKIFDRYVASLPAGLHAKAESLRLLVAGRPAHHRKHGGMLAHDPVHSLFLVPGTGPHVGLPGNYLYGSVLQLTAAADAAWAVHLHDSDDGMALCDTPTMAAALDKLQELLASAPFHLKELDALGFRLK